MKRSKEKNTGWMIFRPLRFMYRTIRSKRDIEANCHFYQAGTIPRARGRQVIAVTDDPSGAAVREAFQKMSQNLRFLFSRPGAQVIGIHSVMRGEGKTFIAANLAATLASSGSKALLIEANLRKPVLSGLLGTSNAKGLNRYLEGGTFEETVQKMSIDHLWMLPAGPVPPNPAELLGNGRFRMLIDRGREEFDYVILDNAPASVVADGLITGAACDLNLFVLRAGVSRKDEFRFIDQLTGTGVLSHLAVALNDY
ncbi:MAG: CpsD/CapB family tyrosine-protein kinase [Mangrovibacterium sp.]